MYKSADKPVSVGDWIITFIILAIPLVNFIALFVWALGSSTHPSKKTYAQATLILIGLAFVFGILIVMLMPVVAPALPASQ